MNSNTLVPGRARLMVADSAAILKRLYFLQRELVVMQAAWMPGTVTWDLKLLLPEFLWEDALVAQELRKRVLELRYPDRRIVPGQDAGLIARWREYRNAPDSTSFCTGSLPALKAYLRRAFSGYMDAADALNDGPTMRILRQAIADIDRQTKRLSAAIAATGSGSPASSRWQTAVNKTLGQADPLDMLGELPELPAFDWQGSEGKPFAIARTGARDPRFKRLLFAWPDRADNSRGPGEGAELQMRVAVHHLNEVWASEMAAAVLHDLVDEAPPEFLEDAARWCYDEIRHCRMGYSRLLEWGYRHGDMPLDSFSYDAAAHEDPLVRLGVIYYFETAYIHTKSERMKIFTRTGDRLSAHDMDFDWADELIHTHYGTRWLKHFLASRADSRTPDDIRDRAQTLVRNAQGAATAADKDATESVYRELLRR